MGQRKRFTPEFKREAVQVLERAGAARLAQELGIVRNQLYKWQTELKARGMADFPGTGAHSNGRRRSRARNARSPASPKSATFQEGCVVPYRVAVDSLRGNGAQQVSVPKPIYPEPPSEFLPP